MAEELIDKYIDRNGVEQDTKFMLDKLNEVYGAFKRLDDVKVGLSGVSGLTAIIPTMKIAQEEIKKMGEATEQLIVTQKKNETAQRQVDKAIAEGRVEKQKYNAEIKRELELQNAANGSIEQARALVKNLTAERNKLNLTTEEGRKRQKELNEEINRANDFIKANVDQLAKQKINVGNYEGSARIIVDALERTRTRLVATEAQFGKLSPEAKAVRGEFEALSRITENPQFLNVSAKFGDATAEVKFFTKALIDLERRGQGSSEAAIELRQNLASLTDEIADTKAEVKALSSDTRQFDLLAGSVSFAADAFQTFAGAAQLLGSSEEDAAKATATLVAVQSVANGVKGIANELTTRGTAANKAYAFVQGLVATSLDRTAAAGTRAKAALGLLGIAATVVGALVVAYAAFSKSASDAAIKQKNLNDVLKDAGGEYAKAIEEVNSLRLNVDLAKKGFISKKEVVDQYNSSMGKVTGQAKDLNDVEQQLNKNAQAYIDFTFAKATATAALAKAAELAVQQQLNLLSGIDQNQVDLLKNATFGGFDKEIEAAAKADFDKRQKSIGKQIDDLIAFANAKQKEAAQKAKDNGFNFFGTADKKDKPEKDNRQSAILEARKIELEAAADLQRQIVEIESFGNSERLKALREFIRIKSEIIEEGAEFERTQKGLTKEDINLINVRELDSLRKLDEESRKLFKITERENVEAKEESAYDMEQISEELTDKLNEDITKWVDENAKQYKKDEENYKELQEKKKQLTTALVSELTNLTFTLFTANLEKQKNAIQEQIDLLDERKLKEIEAVEQTTANEKDKAAAIAIIEAKSAAQREQLQRRQKELDIKKAQFDKAQAIARIVQETAVQIIANLGKPVLIPLIAAIAAAQLAAVIAQPIPRYRTGKNNDNYEGPAIVGDGGKREAHIREDGTVEITPNTPTLTYVKKRDVILPDANQLINYVLAGHMGGRLAIAGNGANENSVEKEIKAMRKEVVQAIQNQPKLSLQTNEQGLAAMWKHGANQIRYINEQTNW